jgi:hypothetical protein
MSRRPTVVSSVLGDSEGIRLEHAVELFRLRGGGVMGDLAGLPESRLGGCRAPPTSCRLASGSWTAPFGCWR